MLVQPIRERAVINDLKDPILISAFSSHQKGGVTASSALGYAIGKWDAEVVASFEADECYNFARMRPWVARNGDRTEVNWPQNVVYRLDGPEHTYLLLLGVEPSLNWRAFVAGIADFAMRMGVHTSISLKSVPGAVPHTVKAPIRALCSAPELYRKYGLEELEDQDGPADIGRILNLHLASMGCRTIDLYALEPFYASAMPDAVACLSLLQALKDTFHLAVDTADLRDAAETQRRSIDAAVATSEQLRETVTALERRYSSGGRLGGSAPQLPSPEGAAEPLNASDVLAEAEAIFKDFGKPA